jgi:hypothetical protein
MPEFIKLLDWKRGMATIRDKMGHCLHEFFTMRRSREQVAIRDAEGRRHGPNPTMTLVANSIPLSRVRFSESA